MGEQLFHSRRSTSWKTTEIHFKGSSRSDHLVEALGKRRHLGFGLLVYYVFGRINVLMEYCGAQYRWLKNKSNCWGTCTRAKLKKTTEKQSGNEQCQTGNAQRSKEFSRAGRPSYPIAPSDMSRNKTFVEKFICIRNKREHLKYYQHRLVLLYMQYITRHHSGLHLQLELCCDTSPEKSVTLSFQLRKLWILCIFWCWLYGSYVFLVPFAFSCWLILTTRPMLNSTLFLCFRYCSCSRVRVERRTDSLWILMAQCQS